MYLLQKCVPYLSLAFAILCCIFPTLNICFVGVIVICILIIPCIECFVSKKLTTNEGKTVITLEYGDLFQKKGGIIVIPVDRNFNTVVDDAKISSKTLHGQFIKNHCPDGSEHLAEVLKKELGEPYEDGSFPLQEPGKVVSLECNGTTYYLLALSELDEKNVAYCNPKEYVRAITGLLEYVNTMFNGKAVYMPLIGSGLSQAFGSKNDTESLQILVSLIRLLANPRIENITIVVRGKIRDRAKIHCVR